MAPDYEKATNMAYELLASNPEYKQGVPVNFSAIVKDLNLKVCFDGTIQDEALLDPAKQTILIKKSSIPQRMFFSLAHEIGHWLLHSKDRIRYRKSTYQSGSLEEVEEQEANAFAAELLLPFNEVKAHIKQGFDAESLAILHNVSYEFASYRFNFVMNRLLYYAG